MQYPDVQRVLDAAARKGVALDVRMLGAPAESPDDAAAMVGCELGQVVRTCVFVAARPEGRLAPIVCLMSGPNRVDARLLAAVAGESAVRRATPSEVRELIGLSIDGVPPFGHPRNVRVVMDQDLGAYQWVWVMVGSDMAVARLTPGVLRMLANAFVTPIAETSWLPTVGSPFGDHRLTLEAGSRP